MFQIDVAKHHFIHHKNINIARLLAAARNAFRTRPSVTFGRTKSLENKIIRTK